MAELVKKLAVKVTLIILFFVMGHYSEQVHDLPQSGAMQNIMRQLRSPAELSSSSWSENSDFCNIPLPILTLVCYGENITQLHITSQFLPRDISTSALFSNLQGLPDLKVLSLVSLGLTGPLPSSIGLLSSLEILNISSNCFSGSLPVEMSSLKSLRTLVLDNNRFAGQVPEWLASLPALTLLSLRNNSFTGSLPNSLATLEPLRTLVASANNLSGNLPDFHKLRNLQVVDLEGNGFGPNFPILPTKLVSLVLRKNRFGFGIPDGVVKCYMLKKMDVSLNEFAGPFPPSLLTMPSIDYLDVSGNKLTGKLFKNMSCNPELWYVGLSSNRLTGELPECLEPGNGHIKVSYWGNCLSNNADQWQHGYEFCRNEAMAVGVVPRRKHEEKKGRTKVVLITLSIIGGLVGGAALVGLAVFFCVKEKFADKTPRVRQIMEDVSPAYTLKLLNDARYISENRKLGLLLGFPPYRTFGLDELREATNNFDASNIIAEGSCGQIYKGLLTDGTVVAIRALKMMKKHSIQHYTHQLELISKIRHCNLVSAIGHSFEYYQEDNNHSCVTTIFLVFEFVRNRTLREAISDGQKFSWSQRMAAALGIARGIQFLHTGIVPGIFSNELKITNILLADHHIHVKISKYNLPLLAAAAAENNKCDFKEKDDVYGFGVILLEMIVGRKIINANDIDLSKDILYVSLAADELARRSIVDPSICKECSDHSLKTMMDLCLRCVSNHVSGRPSVEDLIWNVQFAAQLQELWHRDSKPS